MYEPPAPCHTPATVRASQLLEKSCGRRIVVIARWKGLACVCCCAEEGSSMWTAGGGRCASDTTCYAYRRLCAPACVCGGGHGGCRRVAPHRLCDGSSSSWLTTRASNCCSIRLLKQVSSAVTACSTLSCVVALRLPCAGPITDSLR